MRLPDRAIHVVLIAASLATLATSMPEEMQGDEEDTQGDELVARTEGLVTAPGSRRVSVFLNLPATEQADEIWVEFAWPEEATYDVMTVVPDHENVETVRITGEPVTVDATEACTDPGPCTIRFTIEAPFEGVGTVFVTARLVTFGLFSDDAAVEVAYDE
jgi:hypothetical protein